MSVTKKDNYTTFSTFKVSSADADINARLRLGALTNFLIQSAIESADLHHFGFTELREQNLFWVLSRLTVQIEKPLNWYDKVKVETWHKNLDRIMYLRDFLIRDQNNEIVAKGTSGWLAVDLKTKRPSIVDGMDPKHYQLNRDKHALQIAPEKIAPVKEGEEFIIKSTYSDIDLNKHVTATKYIDWMMDSLPIEFHLKNYPKSLSINYLKETMPGESILLKKHQQGTVQYFFEGQNLDSQTAAFRGKITFN